MKKIYLFLFAILLSGALMAQTRATLFTETFDGASLPAGWGATTQASNWSISNSNNAGGEARELKLYWSPQFNGKTRMVSPVIDLTGVSTLAIQFAHFLT